MSDTPDYENMSDEDIMNIDIASLPDDDLGGDDNATEEEPEGSEEDQGESDTDSEAEDGEDDSADEDQEDESDKSQLDADSDDGSDDSEDDADETDEDDKDASDEDEADESDKVATISDADKIAAYDTLMGKIKANGVDIQVESVDDAVRLQQMGAGFHKKMEQIKPVRKIGQMLQNHNLLNEDKINFFIELEKGDPAAIKQLLKDKKINPLDLDMETDTEYKSKAYTTTNQELDLTDTLGDIQDTPSGKETIDIVSNKWDDASRQVIAKHPEVLHAINDHIKSGVYKTIDDKVQSERALGKLKGMSAIDAYKQVGDQLFPKVDTPTKHVATPKQKAANAKVKSRKKASNPPKTKTPKSTKQVTDVDLSLMTDDEFDTYFDSVNFN